MIPSFVSQHAWVTLTGECHQMSHEWVASHFEGKKELKVSLKVSKRDLITSTKQNWEKTMQFLTKCSLILSMLKKCNLPLDYVRALYPTLPASHHYLSSILKITSAAFQLVAFKFLNVNHANSWNLLACWRLREVRWSKVHHCIFIYECRWWNLDMIVWSKNM